MSSWSRRKSGRAFQVDCLLHLAAVGCWGITAKLDWFAFASSWSRVCSSVVQFFLLLPSALIWLKLIHRGAGRDYLLSSQSLFPLLLLLLLGKLFTPSLLTLSSIYRRCCFFRIMAATVLCLRGFGLHAAIKFRLVSSSILDCAATTS